MLSPKHSAGCVCSVQTGGLRVGVGCARYTSALHRHDLCLPPGQRQNGTPVKFFQLQLAKFSFGQLSPWAGLAPPGQGSLGDADPSSEPAGSAPSMEAKLTAGSCCSPGAQPPTPISKASPCQGAAPAAGCSATSLGLVPVSCSTPRHPRTDPCCTPGVPNVVYLNKIITGFPIMLSRTSCPPGLIGSKQLG